MVVLVFGQVLDWTSFLLDSHCAHLVMNPVCAALVTQLSSLVNLHIPLCEQIESLRGVLRNYTHDASLAPRQPVGEYCVEVLYL